ncbi:MAG: glycine betaine ABC transporter substrate-binding protein [Nocardioidaceae bacterium]
MRKARRVRTVAVVVLVLLAGALQACSNKSGGLSSSNGSRTITIGEVQGYSDDVAINALWKHLLEKKGWQVKIKKLQLGAMFGGMAHGGIDTYLDVWLPTTHGTYVEKYKDQLKVLNTAWNKQAKLGLAVPDYSDLKSLADLPANSGKLDGKILGIEAASGEMKLLDKKIMPSYRLDHKFKLVPSSTPAMLASLRGAMSKKEPIVVVLWKPHWAWSQFNIRFLDDPKHAWPPPETVHIAMSDGFAGDHPQLSKWFGHTKLSSKQWSSLMAAIEAKDGHAQRGVRSWLKKPGHQQLVNSWTDG